MKIQETRKYVERRQVVLHGNTDGSPRTAETNHRTNKNRMWVNGKYI